VSAWSDYQAVYVHIPFCQQKCLYCDFASYAGFSEEQMRRYTDALCHELEVRAQFCGGSPSSLRVAPHATIYFGGGTPSVLPLDCLARLVAKLRECGIWQEPAEATIEVNPGTVDLAKLRGLRTLGFDRVSFGVQSLNDAELRAIGRIHSAAQALETIELARAAGFARISCDLIYGLPGQSLASLQNTLERLLATGVEHLSVYGLIVEEGTPLEHLVASGRLVLPDEDATADMYELVQELLARSGFERYEVSNYARDGQYSRHNCVYWQYHPYVAFGAAACGFDGFSRRTACADVAEYIAKASALTVDGWRDSELYTVEELESGTRLAEFMFMGLRRTRGADLREAEARFGVDVMQRYAKELERCQARGLVRYLPEQGVLRLTERGMELGNQVFEIFVTD
jgi:oxygen-independent coproporphyrinogen-3 oxidase